MSRALIVSLSLLSLSVAALAGPPASGLGPTSLSPSRVAPASVAAVKTAAGFQAPQIVVQPLQTEVFYVEGRLAARAILEDFEGGLTIEGSYPGIPSRTLRLPAVPSGANAWVFTGRPGQSLTLRQGSEEAYEVEVRCPGQPLRTERWLPATNPEAILRPGPGFEVEVEVRGAPQDLVLAVVSDDPAFQALEGLVYLESLGRLPLGAHSVRWPGRDRSAEGAPLPSGTYRLELRERTYLPAPGVTPRPSVVATSTFCVR